jgi:UDP-N-acetylglucosamine acyltransferase
MPLIHPTAVISVEANLAENVRVGAYAVIDGPVVLGAGCTVAPHAHLIGPLTLGETNTIGSGAVLGGDPQHLAYKGQPTHIEIGNGNTFREHTTVHRAMPLGEGQGSGVTRIGDGNLFMVGAHVAHDCRVGNNGIYVNSCLLGGHVETGDRVIVSGNSAVHQFCRIGRLAMISGASAATKDVPPYWIQRGINRVSGVNTFGMRRAGMNTPEIMGVRAAFKMIYLERLPINLAVERMKAELSHLPAVLELIAFIQSSRRGICGASRYERDHSERDAA